MKNLFTKKNVVLCILFIIFSILLVLSAFCKFETAIKVDYGTNNRVLKSIKSGDTIEKTFISRVDNLETVGISVENNRLVSSGIIYVSIYDENDKLIYYNDISKAELFDVISINFKFEPIPNSQFKKFRIVIKANDTNKKFTLKLLDTETKNLNGENLIINKKNVNNNLAIIQYGKGFTHFYTVTFTIILMIIFLIFIRINFYKNDWLKEKIYSRMKFVFIIEFIVSFSSFYSLFKLFVFSKYYFNFSIIWFILFFGFFSILISILALFVGDKRLKKEQLFLLLGIPVCLAYLVFMMPLAQPDGFYHYNIAYRISTGNVFSNTVLIPKGMNNYYSTYLNLVEDINYPNYIHLTKYSSGQANPLLYVLSSIGIFVIRIFNIPPVFGIYLGSILNMILYLLCGYYSVKKIPFKKMLVLVYLLTPMCIQQAVSLSYDVLLNSFSILFICYVLYIRYEKKKIDIRDYLILITSLLFIFICKYVYCFLGLLLILILKELKTFFHKNKKLVLFSILGVLLLYIGWLCYTKFGYPNAHLDSEQLKVPQREQSKLMRLIDHPFDYIPIYIRTIINMFEFYILGFLGNSLGKFNISIHVTYIICYILVFILSIFSDRSKILIDQKIKIINIIIFFLIFNLILFGLYIGYGISSDLLIYGVQGRYLIPIVLLLLLLIPCKNIYIKNLKMDCYIGTLILIIQMLVIVDVIKSFLV